MEESDIQFDVSAHVDPNLACKQLANIPIVNALNSTMLPPVEMAVVPEKMFKTMGCAVILELLETCN
jgi:hypothetical protein